MPEWTDDGGLGRGRLRSGRPRADRAAQFMPFAALTGYYRLVRECERVGEERHELTEEEAATLSHDLMALRPRDLARVTYYDWDSYVTRTGVVDGIDIARRRLKLDGRAIAFDDILSIGREGHPIDPMTGNPDGGSRAPVSG
ncbi:MAG: hypothetical protein SOU51_05610 [Collinsella sp.]|nr:hypothetical protein [Collinsella sp.]